MEMNDRRRAARKNNVYKMEVRPTMMFGQGPTNQMLEMAEMKHVSVMGTKMDRTVNKPIRGTAQVERFGHEQRRDKRC